MSEPSPTDGQRSPADILESIPDPVVAFDKQWRCTYVSRRAAEILGKAPEEMIGKSMWDLFPEDVNSGFQEACQRAWREGKPVTVERHSTVLGLWVESHIYPFEDGAATQWRDITERKRAEEALRASEERNRLLADLLERADQPFGIGYPDGKLGFINSAFERLTGYSRDELQGMDWAAALTPSEWREVERTKLEELHRTGRPVRYEKEYLRKDGTRTPVELLVHLANDDQGRPLYYSFVTDLTERKRAEEALRESEKSARRSEEHHRLLFETMLQGVVYQDAEGRIISMNRAAETILGKTPAEFLGSTSVDQEHHTLREDGSPFPGLEHPSMVALATGREVRNVRMGVYNPREKQYRWIEICAVPLFRAEEPKAYQVYTLFDDITDRKRAEEAVRQASEQRGLALEAAQLGAWDYRFDTGEVFWDERCANMFGETGGEISDTEAIARMRPEDQVGVREALARAIAGVDGGAYDVEFRVVWPDGSEHWITSHGRVYFSGEGDQRRAVRFIGVNLDISGRKQAEKRLRESQKLESLGLMAGGVAHDFNNLLVGVIGNASLAQDMLPPEHPAAALLNGVLKAGEQAAHLTRQMLAYSGKGKFVVEPLDLSALIPDMSGLVRPSIPKKIALRLELEEDLPAIEADRGQIQQVFMNLALNAAEAMGSHEGLITVRTGVANVDERYMRVRPETAALPPGNYIYLEVRDTGCGMDEATKGRIFDPFFSTKFTGRGLGLAAVAGILRGHKAAITVESAPGQGSCFTVLFPEAEGTAEEAQVPASRAALQGAGVVLVVDDEQLVRELAKRALERHGYEVLLADSGLAAIDVFRRHPGEIALVVLDLSMPHMSGGETLPELRKIRPEVKVVVSSGYSESEAMTLFKGQKVSGFIQKPFTSTGLAEKVKVCLG